MRYLIMSFFVALSACYAPSPVTLDTAAATTEFASSSYWFYIRESQGGFYDKKGVHYSQVLECDKRVSGSGFHKSHAIGPFTSYSEASSARRDEVEIATLTGKKLYLHTVDCNSNWD